MNAKAEFLKTHRPFSLLPEEVLGEVADLLHEVTYSKETQIYQQESSKMKGVDIIAEGEYESFFYDSSGHKRQQEFHGKGYCFGGISVLLNRKRSLKTVVAKKGTKVYFLHRREFRQLCQAYDDFFHYFTAEFGKRMLDEEFSHFAKHTASFDENYIASDQLYSRRLDSVELRDIVACPEDTPAYDAARMMASAKVSCLFVTNPRGAISGYVTDITLRDKIVAGQLSASVAVRDIMDNPVVPISAAEYVYEAILMMFRTKTRYLLVGEEGNYKGFLSRNKLLGEQAQSPMVFIQSVKSSRSVPELKSKWQKVPEIVAQLLARGVNSEIVNEMITTISDTIALKVIESVIGEVGPPPARFVYMVLGSEGRKEQTLKTDQDNAIIYEDKANEHRELVREYFLNFATMVSNRLNEIGFSYCTGGFMAMNPNWTHSLSHWKRNYTEWMQESLPETVIKFSTFFDCRYIYGDPAIMDELQEFLDNELRKPMDKLFFYMTRNALQYEPPLTFFKNIRTITVGSREVFDIKKAMTPIVDLVRVYALKHRIFKVNTGERLKALREAGVFTGSSFHELMQCYYFLMGLRLKNQSRKIINDKKEPDNYIDLNDLTRIEQVTLREIFKTIENFQSAIRIEFTSNLFG
jgi:CBS domain-containing protein